MRQGHNRTEALASYLLHLGLNFHAGVVVAASGDDGLGGLHLGLRAVVVRRRRRHRLCATRFGRRSRGGRSNVGGRASRRLGTSSSLRHIGGRRGLAVEVFKVEVLWKWRAEVRRGKVSCNCVSVNRQQLIAEKSVRAVVAKFS